MNLFIAGQGLAPIDVEQPRQALAALLLELPFFSGDAIETWRAPTGHIALCSVPTGQSGSAPAEYACFEEGRAAMFSGRPVRWSTGGHADGRLAIDPRRYVDAREGWAAELDGRCTVIRAGEDFLEIYTDPLGAYPVVRRVHHRSPLVQQQRRRAETASTRLLPHLLALRARERELEQFHLLVLTVLDPRLVAPRFDDGSTWPERRYPVQRRVQRARRLLGKVAAELRRRSAARPRVERLLGSPPVLLDEMSRYYVWRLASVFLGMG